MFVHVDGLRRLLKVQVVHDGNRNDNSTHHLSQLKHYPPENGYISYPG